MTTFFPTRPGWAVFCHGRAFWRRVRATRREARDDDDDNEEEESEDSVDGEVDGGEEKEEEDGGGCQPTTTLILTMKQHVAVRWRKVTARCLIS